MEEWLNLISEALTIRVTVEEHSERGVNVKAKIYKTKDVSKEVREQFKTELYNHLCTKLQEIEVGEYVDYSFNFGKVKQRGTLMEDANDNLAEVLLKLPPLKEGECYELPCNICMRFVLKEKDDQTERVYFKLLGKKEMHTNP